MLVTRLALQSDLEIRLYQLKVVEIAFGSIPSGRDGFKGNCAEFFSLQPIPLEGLSSEDWLGREKKKKTKKTLGSALCGPSCLLRIG